MVQAMAALGRFAAQADDISTVTLPLLGCCLLVSSSSSISLCGRACSGTWAFAGGAQHALVAGEQFAYRPHCSFALQLQIVSHISAWELPWHWSACLPHLHHTGRDSRVAKDLCIDVCRAPAFDTRG